MVPANRKLKEGHVNHIQDPGDNSSLIPLSNGLANIILSILAFQLVLP